VSDQSSAGASPDPPVYHYDAGLGDVDAVYRRADEVHPEAHGPEIAGVFAARVDGATTINTMWGRREVPWVAEPGTRCVILGYWSDGTVRLRWPAIAGAYRVDGRFPSWVVVADPQTPLAGGGHLLDAHDPGDAPRGLSPKVQVALMVLVLIAVLLLLPPTRDAIGALFGH
jgi:hypothetical protein